MDSTADEERMTLRLPPVLHKALRQLSAKEHRSLNGQVVFMLERAVAQENGEPHG